MVFNQISQPRQRVSLRIAFSELDALSGSKTSGCTTSPHLRFSNHGRSGGSQTTPPMARALGPVQRPWQIGWFSNALGLACRQKERSATVADRAVLKPAIPQDWLDLVQQPWQIGRFSNLWAWICRLNWAFLFQRTAKSARSSCFCDPPGRFFDRALGSPQASIPTLTAVWVHYSRTIP